MRFMANLSYPSVLSHRPSFPSADRLSFPTLSLCHGYHAPSSSDEEESFRRRMRKRASRVWHPQLVEFPTLAAKEEEMFFTKLLAFPWQRGRHERLVQRLEKKFFPTHGLDSFMSAAYRSRQLESGQIQGLGLTHGASSSMGARDSEKFDYPKIAKALSTAFASKHSFRSQPSNSVAENRCFWLASSCDQSKAHLPSIRTIRAPLSSTDPSPSPNACNSSVEAPKVSVDVEEQVELKKAVKPLLLKSSSVLPKLWNPPGGIAVLIDKPKRWTSFDVCSKLRHLIKVKKVGHAGTLDPLATGLLVVCVGTATKLIESYQALPKVYTGTFRLGEATPTDDADSEVKERKPWEHITDEEIGQAKNAFVGDIMQIPPMFSAIKVQGERLYEKARRGEKLDIPARRVSIYEFDVKRSEIDRQNLTFRVTCSKGTYVRSLCADLGRALGSCAHLIQLRRDKIGDLLADEAWNIMDLEAAISQK